jgi:hypothetical protein
MRVIQEALRPLQIVGQFHPLLAEIPQHPRVLGLEDHFGQFLTTSRVKTTLFRIAGHSVTPSKRAPPLAGPAIQLSECPRPSSGPSLLQIFRDRSGA